VGREGISRHKPQGEIFFAERVSSWGAGLADIYLPPRQVDLRISQVVIMQESRADMGFEEQEEEEEGLGGWG